MRKNKPTDTATSANAVESPSHEGAVETMESHPVWETAITIVPTIQHGRPNSQQQRRERME